MRPTCASGYIGMRKCEGNWANISIFFMDQLVFSEGKKLIHAFHIYEKIV